MFACMLLAISYKLGPIHTGSQAISPKSLETNMCNLSCCEHGSWDLPLHIWSQVWHGCLHGNTFWRWDSWLVCWGLGLGDHGTPNVHNRWFILFNHVWGPAWPYWLSPPCHVRLHTTLEDPWPYYMILEASWDNLYSLSFGLSQRSTQVMLIFLHKNNCDPTSMIINHIFKGFFEAHKLGLGLHVGTRDPCEPALTT